MYKNVYIHVHTSHPHQDDFTTKDSILICAKTAVKLNYKTPKKGSTAMFII
jgi:hypothetical protein